MKIAYLLTTWPSRTETFAAREINHLNLQGFTITILAATANRPVHSVHTQQAYRPPIISIESSRALIYLAKKYPCSGLKLMILILQLTCVCPKEALRLLINLHTIAYFTRVLDRKGIRHLHAYFFNWPATVALAISVISGRTFSIAAHAHDLFVQPGAIKRKVSSASFMIICSNYGLTFLESRLPDNLHHKLRRCYHGLGDDLSVFKPCPDTKKSTAPLCLAVARLVPKKGLTVLLHAFNQLRKTYPTAQLIIIGEGPQRIVLQKLTAQLELSTAVKFLGHIPNNQLQKFYQAASLLIVPSIQTSDADCDGVPNVILEAFATNLPVVATKIGGIPEAVIHKKTGLLVTPDSPNELAQMISTLLADKTLQKSLTDQAACFLTEKFNLKKNLMTLANLFREMTP